MEPEPIQVQGTIIAFSGIDDETSTGAQEAGKVLTQLFEQMLGTQAIMILHVWTDDNKQEDANFPILYMAIKGWETAREILAAVAQNATLGQLLMKYDNRARLGGGVLARM